MASKQQAVESGDTILVVDDQIEVLTAMQRLLEREGFRVLAAQSGARALELFKENEVALILTDYFMPRMTGEELVRETRKLDRFVQIILLTGYSGEKPSRVMLRELDIQGYHDKADGPDKLLLWVDIGLKAHRTIRCLRERERLQGELVANVSHEFRTPLNIIGGYTGLLLDGAFGDVPSEALVPLRSITEATTNLTELVSDFLSYSKLDSRATDVACQLVSISELGQELTRLASLLLEDKSVDFSAELQDAPPGLLTDSLKLRTVLRNLVINAAKFTSRGKIELRIFREGDTVRFSVRDTGPGIRDEDLSVIFEPFRQLKTGANRSAGGIGLGLAMSKKLARVLGGDLDVESTLGVGSTFTLVLPVLAVTSESSDRARRDSSNGAADGEGRLLQEA